MIRQYRFRELMQMLTSEQYFVLRGPGERYFFAKVTNRG